MDSRRDERDTDLCPGQCDTDDDGQWLTYVQLAEKRGVTLRAVMRQAQRQKLRRQPGNDGKTLVWVPRDKLEVSHRASQEPSENFSEGVRSDRAGDVAVAVAALERAHERELAAKDALIGELKTAATRAELQASVAQERLQQMERAEAARKARSRWRAAWLALRGG